MHMLLRFSTVILGKKRMPIWHTRDKEVPSRVFYNVHQQFKPQKCKSFHIFRYSPKPIPAVVTNIKNELMGFSSTWVPTNVHLTCPLSWVEHV